MYVHVSKSTNPYAFVLYNARKNGNTYVVPQAAYCCCSGAVCHRAGVQPRPQSGPTPTEFGLQQNSHTQPRCNYIDCYSFTDPRGGGGRLSWPSWLTHSGQFTHKVVTCQPYIGHRSRKVCQPETDVLTTEPHR